MCVWCVFSFSENETLVEKTKRLWATDILALASMKDTAKCDSRCELQNSASHCRLPNAFRAHRPTKRPYRLGHEHACFCDGPSQRMKQLVFHAFFWCPGLLLAGSLLSYLFLRSRYEQLALVTSWWCYVKQREQICAECRILSLLLTSVFSFIGESEWVSKKREVCYSMKSFFYNRGSTLMFLVFFFSLAWRDILISGWISSCCVLRVSWGLGWVTSV